MSKLMRDMAHNLAEAKATAISHTATNTSLKRTATDAEERLAKRQRTTESNIETFKLALNQLLTGSKASSSLRAIAKDVLDYEATRNLDDWIL
ncbi:Fc.00g109130.m01.CDS01 [Cosmosporella sp. VM-42]